MNLALLVLAQVAVSVAGPDTVSLREPATITVQASAPGSVAPRIVPPNFRPFSGWHAGSAERVSVGYGEPWATAEHRYTLVALRPGTYTLPPFVAIAGRSTARTRPLTIVVRDPATDPTVPAIVRRATLDPSQPVNFRALVSPDTVYVGEQATYQVGVFLDDAVRARLRRNPEFVPPEPRGMLAYDLPVVGRALPARRAGDRRYEAHVFQRALFPIQPGRVMIPPARLLYSVPLSASFFSREESHTLRSDSLALVVLEPPAAGRPTDWTGAVGQLQVSARVDSAARVGDPVVLTLRVTGTGNVKLFPRPELQIPWASVVRAEERVQLDSQSLTVRGSKEFDWVVTPRTAGALDLPPLRYPYFDPVTERYEIAVTPPATIVVAPGTLAAVDTAQADTRPRLALRSIYRGPLGDPLTSHPAFWLLALAAPLPAAALTFVRRPRRQPSRPPAAALAALAANPAPLAGELRRAYATALSSRLALAPDVLTRHGGLTRALRRAGVTRETAVEAEMLLEALDGAAYSAAAPLEAGAARRAYDLYLRVDTEARPRLALLTRALQRSLPVMLLGLGAALGAGLLEARTSAAEARFAAGLAAYDDRRFAESARHFADVVRLEPRAADGWANFGTAGWAAGDTAAAVVGWQRALRLEPLAGDARDRLALVDPPQTGRIAGVPPIPESPVAALALVAWLGAWCVVAARTRRRRPAVPVLAWGGGAGALALLATALVAREARLARDRAVVADAGPLRPIPALAADSVAALAPGDVAQTLDRRGVWTHVRLAGDRDGWVETERLIPLGVAR